MKWILIFSTCLLACHHPAENSKSLTQKASNANEQQQKPPTVKLKPVSNEIIPGKSIGLTTLGDDAEKLEKSLGKPDLSDAAMGKAWLTWNGKKDEHNNVTQLNIFTAYSNNEMKEKTVQQIRTTSSYFLTADSLHVYSSLNNILKKFPGVKKSAEYKDDGRTISIYDEKEKGIAFEIAAANGQQTCTGIIIHKKGESTIDIYRTLHPDMKVYRKKI
jgi:hypothetical protein